MKLDVRVETWPLKDPIRITGYVFDSFDFLVVTLEADGLVGRGEASGVYYRGDLPAGAVAQVEALRSELAGLDRDRLAGMLPPGCARNALDCALWDLESRRSGRSVAALLGQPDVLPPLASAQTVGLDTPERMALAARALAHLDLVKIKVDADDPTTRIRAVRSALPHARLIVDPNESWTLAQLSALQPVLAEARVDLVEQPLPAAEDEGLAGFRSVARLCADESCHVAADLPRLRDRYQVVNIKLDKSGGLTAALDLLAAAQAQGFGIMVGCMICTSLAIAPAWHVARHAEFVDLDGPLWLVEDHPGGATMRGDGLLQPPAPRLWGGGSAV